MYIDLGFRKLTMVQSENLVATLINLLAFTVIKNDRIENPVCKKHEEIATGHQSRARWCQHKHFSQIKHL